MSVRYVPILKGKEGEYGALDELFDDAAGDIMPLIEIPDIAHDWERDRPAKSLQDHVAGVADRLQKAWAGRPFFLDFRCISQENLEDGESAMRFVLEQCAELALHVVPVLSRTSSAGHMDAAIRHHAAHGAGVCLRLTSRDFTPDVEIEEDIARLLENLETTPEHVDIVIDLANRFADPDVALLVVKSIKGDLPHRDDWRRMILSASSFPQDLSEVNADDTQHIRRLEWELWQRVQQRPARALRGDLIFSDYAIAHPEPREMNPRLMRMSASIRYTTNDSWLILKGRNVRQWGYDQFFELCADLVKRKEYSGPAFSWGDQYIAACARRETGPGNATTWRKVATNHHLTLVAKALATPPVP